MGSKNIRDIYLSITLFTFRIIRLMSINVLYDGAQGQPTLACSRWHERAIMRFAILQAFDMHRTLGDLPIFCILNSSPPVQFEKSRLQKKSHTSGQSVFPPIMCNHMYELFNQVLIKHMTAGLSNWIKAWSTKQSSQTCVDWTLPSSQKSCSFDLCRRLPAFPHN